MATPFYQLLIEHRAERMSIVGTMANNPTADYLTAPKIAGDLSYNGRTIHFYYWCEDRVSPLSLDSLIDFIMAGMDHYAAQS